MEFSPSKRRKISPLTSIPAGPLNTPTRPVSQHGQRPSSHRASFMSPTKASLARFNPNLLPRTTSAEPRRPSSRGHQDLPRTSLDFSGNEHESNGVASQLPALSLAPTVTAGNGVPVAQAPQTPRNNLSAAPRRKSQTPGTGHTPSRQPQKRAVDDSRASPLDADAEAEDQGLVRDRNGTEVRANVAVFTDRREHEGLHNEKKLGLEESHVPLTSLQSKDARFGAHIGREEDGEPSLPSTPTQLGLEAPLERPKGLLFSSPSRRPRRRDNANSKPSPLKFRNALPTTLAGSHSPAIAVLGPKIFLPNLPKPPLTSEELETKRKVAEMIETENLLKESEVDLLGRLLLSKWQKEDTKQKRELQKRRKIVCDKADRFLQLRHEIRQLQPAMIVTVGESNVPQTNEEGASHTGKTSMVRPSVTQCVSLFLPFSGRPPPPLPKPPSIDDFGATPSQETGEMPDGPAPFSVKISNVALLPRASDGDALQQQDVEFITPHQSNPLALQLTIDTTTQRLIRINTVHLPPWAAAELGIWLQEAPDGLDIEAIGKAVGRYWSLSQLRARCWHRCKTEFPDLTVNAVSPNGMSPIEHPEQEHLGYQSQQFSLSSVSAIVYWRLSFTHEGEIESHVSAKANFPTAWKQADRSDELGKVGLAFDLLVRDRGVTDAVRMLLQLIFPP